MLLFRLHSNTVRNSVCEIMVEAVVESVISSSYCVMSRVCTAGLVETACLSGFSGKDG